MAKSFDSTSGEQTWITPKWIVESLGHFDLDPCAADVMPYNTADRMVTKQEDGLKVDWCGKRVWLNPPYGRDMPAFLEKMSRGIALLPSRTDNAWFHELVLPKCSGIFFLRGRIKFISKDGSDAGTPAFASMLVPYSDADRESILASGIRGRMVDVV